VRHKWTKDSPRKGYSTCSNCDLTAKTYKIKKGRLPRCDPEAALDKPRLDCKRHDMAAIAGARQCWNCGVLYTPAELEAGRIKQEKLIDSAITQNPPLITI